MRNEFNHCMYITDASGQITHTQSMRIVQTKSSLQFGEMKPMDEARLKSMVKSTKDMARINRDICCRGSKAICVERRLIGLTKVNVPARTAHNF